MTFDKKEYRKNRENVVEIKDDKGKVIDRIFRPLRGQGPRPNKFTKVTIGPAPPTDKPVSKKALRKNTKRARKAAERAEKP